MSLFAYKIQIEGNVIKTGRRTAKSEKEARERISKDFKVVEWLALSEEHSTPKSTQPPSKTTPAVKPTDSKLSRMLYLQAGLCFFCKRPLSIGEASIEHLLPKAHGGKSTNDNEVVCCKRLNQTFGSLELKRKFEFVLLSAGNFKCPAP